PHAFRPLLRTAGTTTLPPAEMAMPLRSIFRKAANVQVLLAEVETIDLAARRIVLDEGEIDYDALVLAPGAGHSYFGHDEWEQLAPGLKTLEDAIEIRRRILLAFGAAAGTT